MTKNAVNKISLKSSVTLVALLISSNTYAAINEGVYIGAKTGWSHFNASCESQSLDCDKEAWGGGLFLGYKFNEWISIEGGYDYFGKAKSTYPMLGDPSVNTEYTGTAQGLELGLKGDYGLTDNLSLFAKAGMLGWQVKNEGAEATYNVSEKDTGVSPMLGAGLEYAFTSNLAGRVEYQWFNNVGGEDTGGSNLHFATVGLVYSFGGDSEPAPVVIEPVPNEVVDTYIPPKEEAVVITLSDNTMNNITFKTDSYNLSNNVERQLNPMLTRLEMYPETEVFIVGHTDSTGPQSYNQTLSVKRAQSVANFFEARGIDSSRIHVDGRGELDPIETNATVEGRAMNRRVELTSPSVDVIKE